MQVITEEGRPRGILASRLANWTFASKGKAFCQRFELANRLCWRLPISVSWQADTGLYIVQDKSKTKSENAAPDRIMIARPERVFRYRRGVANRVNKLARKYFVDRVPLSTGDVVLDCGANVGELGMHIEARAAVRLIAVEPCGPEARACDENLFSGHPNTHQVSLWNDVGQKPLYDSNVAGDSSLIVPATTHTSVTTVPVTTLDRLVTELGIDRIKLLKIDGEGAEPEILAGSMRIISRVSHCTIDCGPERGPDREHVIPPICNSLIGAGFELLDVNLERQIYWFRNQQAV